MTFFYNKYLIGNEIYENIWYDFYICEMEQDAHSKRVKD